MGVTEQAVCAGGRVFVGTRDSTFSSYIVRLRGYVGAPDTSTYVHTDVYSADMATNALRNTHLDGSRYKMEWEQIWSDIKHP